MRTYRYQSQRRRRKGIKVVPAGLLAVFLIGMMAFFLKSNPQLKPEVLTNKPVISTAEQVNLPWPAYGQSAVGAQGNGVLATNVPNSAPVPIASLAKVMTALAVLKAHPLAVGEQGPNVPISDEDVTSFNDYTAKNGTNTKVVAGEQISQYQAMQAMLIRSSNNMADTLARWSYGSAENYTAFANNYAKDIGLSNSYFADASGFSPQTVGTAEDLVLLGEQAMDQPVIAEIVSQWQANIPEAGQIHNTNLFLDFENNGVIGIKTGETEQAGGTYLAAAKYKLANDQSVTIIAAVLGAPSHFAAQKDAMPLLIATRSGFRSETIMTTGQTVGKYQVPWGREVEAVAKDKVSGLAWGNQVLIPRVTLNAIISPVKKSAQVGTIAVSDDGERVPVVLKDSVTPPSLFWRIRHLLQ